MFIMHERSMDVAFKIKGTKYNEDGSKRFIGHWWNLGYTGNPWPCEYTTRMVTIEKNNWLEWKLLHPGQEYITRTKPGKP